jgi:hypothetical protein
MNRITGNYAGGEGGGISSGLGSDTYTFIMSNTIIGNTSENNGGGVQWGGWTFSDFVNNTVIANSARRGGGAAVGHCSPILKGNTFFANSADSGGAISCHGGSPISPIVHNTIFWGNTALFAKEIYLHGHTNIRVSYSDVQGGWEGEGNINSAPVFVLPDKGDCRLLWGSPCIDSGHPDMLDPDGTRSDMGAHFFDQEDHLTLYVTPDKLWGMPGERFGVTYTAINRWGDPETFWCLSQVFLPDGNSLDVLGPEQFTIQGDSTIQVHKSHLIRPASPKGMYEYWSRIGETPEILYDEDRFKFLVTQ